MNAHVHMLVGADGKVGTGVGFFRLRRITGYLVGDLARFNDGKRAEERDRVKHAKASGEDLRGAS